MPTKSPRCSGSSSVVGRLLLLGGLGEDHLPHGHDALFAEEHVLGAAQADALGPTLAGVRRLVGRVGVGAHPQTAPVVGDGHQTLERAPERLLHERPRRPGGAFSSSDSSSGSSPTKTLPVNPSIVIDVALAHLGAVRRELSVGDAELDRVGAAHRGDALAASDDRRVGVRAPGARQDALGGDHAVVVVGRGLASDEDDLLPRLAASPAPRRR